jgi:parallel beta-helix repeat protein
MNKIIGFVLFAAVTGFCIRINDIVDTSTQRDALVPKYLGVSAAALGVYHPKITSTTGRMVIDSADSVRKALEAVSADTCTGSVYTDTALWADTTPIAGHSVFSDIADSSAVSEFGHNVDSAKADFTVIDNFTDVFLGTIAASLSKYHVKITPTTGRMAIDSLDSVAIADSAKRVPCRIVIDGRQYAQTGAGIQAAITALPSTGGEIIIPHGIYLIDTTILINKNAVYLVGQGTGWNDFGADTSGTMLRLNDAKNCDMINFNSTTHKYFGGIKNLGLYGNRTQQSAESNGIVISGFHTDLYFENLVVAYFNGCGVKLISNYNIWNFFMNRCLLEYCDTTLISAHATANNISWLHILGCHLVADYSAKGILFQAGTYQIGKSFITDNIITNAKTHGIVLKSCRDIQISNNIIQDYSVTVANSSDGIFIYDDTTHPSFNIEIANNRIGTLTGNPFTRYGVSINSVSDSIIVSDNNLSRNIKGIFTVAGANTHGVVNNYLFDSSFYWINKKLKCDTVISVLFDSVGKLTATGTATVDTLHSVKGAQIDGNLGVGCVPGGRLNVAKAANDNLIYADDYSTTTGHGNYWFSRKSSSNTNGTLAQTGTNDYLGAFYFQGVDNTAAFDYGAKIYAIQNGAAGVNVPTDLVLETYSATAANTNLLRLSNTGFVGVLTTNPTMALTVKGNILDTGNIFVYSATGKVTITSTTGANAAYYTATNTGGSLWIGRDKSTGGEILIGGAAYGGVITTQGNYAMQIGANAALVVTVLGTKNTGFGGLAAPTAQVHCAAPSATTAGKAPIKLTSGAVMATPEAGAMEFLTDTLYFTPTTGPTRKKILLSNWKGFTTIDTGYFTTTSASAVAISAKDSTAERRTTGDHIYIGAGSGVPYGDCYGVHIAWSQATAVQNTWYNISDADMTEGELNLVTGDGAGKLTVTHAGRYLITYGITMEVSVANDHIETGIEISGSGSAVASGQSHFENKFANEEEVAAGTTVLSLAAGATIEVSIRTIDGGTPTLSVQSLNITVTMVGG